MEIKPSTGIFYESQILDAHRVQKGAHKSESTSICPYKQGSSKMNAFGCGIFLVMMSVSAVNLPGDFRTFLPSFIGVFEVGQVEGREQVWMHLESWQ